jgi:starch phosphorylase
VTEPVIAYFSMEIGLAADLPTYCGGLGALAGDTIMSAADLGVPMTAISLLYRQGHFQQRLDDRGRQSAEPVNWTPETSLADTGVRCQVEIADRLVTLRAWRYEVAGVSGHVVPVYFLDADLPENTAEDRGLTNQLYGGDDHYRLCQEVLLGIGGVRMLRALGYAHLVRYHMNEGHPALLTFQLLRDEAARHGRHIITRQDFRAVHDMCIFTTHTPVAAGHDQFPVELLDRVLGIKADYYVDFRDAVAVDMIERILHTDAGMAARVRDLVRPGVRLNMTYLALNMSGYVNGVAKKHGETSRHLYSGYEIDAITNGVHLARWASPDMQALFDRYIPDWRRDNFSLRAALSIPPGDFRDAHRAAKRRLLGEVRDRSGIELDPAAFTLGFARRAAAYKRADLLFHDVERLRAIARERGGLQVIYAGKAHPGDAAGLALIERVFAAGRALADDVRVVYLENYDLELAQHMTAGADVWLNTPLPPNEASGTSGMKAAVNGTPSLSVLDGWWIEGCIEGLTGWAIGEPVEDPSQVQDPAVHAASLYTKLADVILPLYYEDPDGFLDVMRHAVALNGAFFNTQRMVQQYVLKAYFPGGNANSAA